MPVSQPRLEQARAAAIRRVEAALEAVDPVDLAGTWPGASRAVLQALTQAQFAAQESVAVALQDALRRGVGLDLGWDVLSHVRPAYDMAAVAEALGKVPVQAARAVAAGADPAEALAQALRLPRQLAGSVAHETARQCAADLSTAVPGFSGWAWVPESGACAFCRMQASRGAVFKSPESKRSHAHCKCKVREVVDQDEAARLHRDGRQAWADMAARGDVPNMGASRGRQEWARSKVRPGSLTPERAAACRAQAAGWQRRADAWPAGFDPENPRLRWYRRMAADRKAEADHIESALASGQRPHAVASDSHRGASAQAEDPPPFVPRAR